MASWCEILACSSKFLEFGRFHPLRLRQAKIPARAQRWSCRGATLSPRLRGRLCL